MARPVRNMKVAPERKNSLKTMKEMDSTTGSTSGYRVKGVGSWVSLPGRMLIQQRKRRMGCKSVKKEHARPTIQKD